jgi:hypothetical protein
MALRMMKGRIPHIDQCVEELAGKSQEALRRKREKGKRGKSKR